MPTFWATDINQKALDAASALMQHNKHIDTNMVESNLFQSLAQEIKFDVIIFNPPYVATDEQELNMA